MTPLFLWQIIKLCHAENLGKKSGFITFHGFASSSGNDRSLLPALCQPRKPVRLISHHAIYSARFYKSPCFTRRSSSRSFSAAAGRANHSGKLGSVAAYGHYLVPMLL